MCWTDGKQDLAILGVRAVTTLDEGEYRLVLSVEKLLFLELQMQERMVHNCLH